MPFYAYQCPDGHQFQHYLSVAAHRATWPCPCGEMATQRITAPAMVKVCADVCYDSPITGEPITNHHARIEDMKRSNSRPYDPEERTDFHRRQSQADQALDQAIDIHVEEAIEKMPTKQRGQLASELLDKSATIEYARSTPNA